MSCQQKILASWYVDRALHKGEQAKKKPALVWLETNGCFGESISLLNADDPDLVYLLTQLVEVRFFTSLMGETGEDAFEEIVKATQEEDLILIVSGGIPVGEYETCAIIGHYEDKPVTAYQAVQTVAKYAKHIIAVGTCASYGGPCAAHPNPSNSKSAQDVLKEYSVIKIPGCPSHPTWLIGTLSAIIQFGSIELDEENRPKVFYGETIHNHCERRGYFDSQQFAKKLGEKECLFQLGCKGPLTKASCPYTRWNSSLNWPIGDNTTCMGCASSLFPDISSPYVNFE